MARNTAKATQMSREAGKTKATDSTIATLAGRTTTETVRAARPAGLKKGLDYTGQYLYDRFIVPDGAAEKESGTKLDIVRDMVDRMDQFKFKTIVGEMVSVAKGFFENAVKAAKDAKTYDENNMSLELLELQARLRTARNHQTVMRTAFGTLKFCADELTAWAGDKHVGYRFFQSADGPMFLKAKGINWDGSKAESPDARKARNEQKHEAQAMQEVMSENPRDPKESRAEYFTRIDKAVQSRMEAINKENREKEVSALAIKIRQLAGENLPDIIELLIAAKDNPGAGGPIPSEIVPEADRSLH